MPRALLWNKWVYELWFKYSLAALEEGMPIPVEFGPIDQFEDFESWWRHEQYGFELFYVGNSVFFVNLLSIRKRSCVHLKKS